MTQGECCEYCKESNNLEHYKDHIIDECPFITSTCFDCNQEFPLSQLNDHIKVCQSKESDSKEEQKEEEKNQHDDCDFNDIENFGSEIDESNFEYLDPQDYGISSKAGHSQRKKEINDIDESFAEVPQIVECEICKIIIEKSQIDDHLFAHNLENENNEEIEPNEN